MIGTSSFSRLSAALAGAAVVAGISVRTVAGEPRRGRDACKDPPCTVALAEGSRQSQRGEERDDRGDDNSTREGRRPKPYGDRSGSYDFSWGYGKGHGDGRAPRPHEWEETVSFMREYAPRRQAALEQMPEGEPKESVKKFVFARYRGIQSLQRRDPTSYEQRLAQLRVEDQIFGIVSDWGGATEESATKNLRDTLRTQVAQLVDLDLQERRRRVEALKRELAEQTELLTRDENQRDALVEKRVGGFADWAERWAERRKQEADKTGSGKRRGKDKGGPAGSDDASEKAPGR